MKDFMKSKLKDTNEEYTLKEKKMINKKNKLYQNIKKIAKKIVRSKR